VFLQAKLLNQFLQFVTAQVNGFYFNHMMASVIFARATKGAKELFKLQAEIS